MYNLFFLRDDLNRNDADHVFGLLHFLIDLVENRNPEEDVTENDENYQKNDQSDSKTNERIDDGLDLRQLLRNQGFEEWSHIEHDFLV